MNYYTGGSKRRMCPNLPGTVRIKTISDMVDKYQSIYYVSNYLIILWHIQRYQIFVSWSKYLLSNIKQENKNLCIATMISFLGYNYKLTSIEITDKII